jgi:hypothetical protein
MNRLLITAGAAVALGIAITSSPSRLQSQQATQTVRSQSVDSIAWLAGCWEQRSANATTREHWSKPAGGTMMGVSFTVRHATGGDVATGHEFLRIHTRDGKAVYSALPSGQSMTDFPIREQNASAVTFENPQHDFPTRISYRRQGADSVVDRVEGTMNGSASAFNIAFRRVPCP